MKWGVNNIEFINGLICDRIDSVFVTKVDSLIEITIYFKEAQLELRQYKNDSIDWKHWFFLNCRPFFPFRSGDEKTRRFHD